MRTREEIDKYLDEYASRWYATKFSSMAIMLYCILQTLLDIRDQLHTLNSKGTQPTDDTDAQLQRVIWNKKALKRVYEY